MRNPPLQHYHCLWVSIALSSLNVTIWGLFEKFWNSLTDSAATFNQVCFVISSFRRLATQQVWTCSECTTNFITIYFSETSCVGLNMEKTEIRAVIKYFHLKGLKAKEIKRELYSTLGGPSSRTTFKHWIAAFKIGPTSTKDESHQRLAEATMPKMIEKIHKMVHWKITESRRGRQLRHKRIIWMVIQYFTGTFEYEEAVRKMSAVFAHTWPKTTYKGHLNGQFGVV